MLLFLFTFILFFQPEEIAFEKGSFHNLKKYFKNLPVEIHSKTLSIPAGIYGARQGFYILKKRNFKILDIKEIPLPNLPGKFKFYILNCKKEDKDFKMLLLLQNYKKDWTVQSFREVP